MLLLYGIAITGLALSIRRSDNSAHPRGFLHLGQVGRLALYDGESGSLSAKMKAIKKATGGQYGRASSQFAEVKGIGL